MRAQNSRAGIDSILILLWYCIQNIAIKDNYTVFKKQIKDHSAHLQFNKLFLCDFMCCRQRFVLRA